LPISLPVIRTNRDLVLEMNLELSLGNAIKKAACQALFFIVLFFGAASADSGTLPSPDENTLKAGDGPPAEAEAEPEFLDAQSVADPLGPWNRMVFTFNDKLYFWVMKPAAKGYNTVVPEGVRISARNFFVNLSMPVRFVNASLQGKIKSAAVELARFGVNTVFGIAGLFDIAKMWKIEGQEKDLGMTLGFYGIGDGLYIVWPFLGPSSLRDTIGSVGDGFLSPVNYVTPAETAFAITAYEYFNDTSVSLGDYESLKEAAIDPYIAVKDSYIQHRRYQINK
jgi:phospholipid-binding lipoprotein MlaA